MARGRTDPVAPTGHEIPGWCPALQVPSRCATARGWSDRESATAAQNSAGPRDQSGTTRRRPGRPGPAPTVPIDRHRHQYPNCPQAPASPATGRQSAGTGCLWFPGRNQTGAAAAPDPDGGSRRYPPSTVPGRRPARVHLPAGLPTHVSAPSPAGCPHRPPAGLSASEPHFPPGLSAGPRPRPKARHPLVDGGRGRTVSGSRPTDPFPVGSTDPPHSGARSGH